MVKHWLARDDRGAAAVVAIPVVLAALALTLLLIAGVGGASQERRGATTAADAAALAAAQQWRDEIKRQYESDTSTDGTIPDFAGRRLADLRADAEVRARHLALANGAIVESLSFDAERAEVKVTTLSTDEFAGALREYRASAVARIEMRTGACREGATLGLLVAGCVTSPIDAIAMDLTTADISAFGAVVTLVR
ncbi:hypothetical protein [Sanguibacter massiliensis]|uniref:hypothetical protein n=1 Tax=Sanguibacter massiliensis TaxID=1973217 RepID=UPI000C82BF1B|nr:hypothetical protein [Sanguibacter massiliensis]